MRNAQVWETEALDVALARVQSLLPASWSLTARPPFGDVEVAPCDRVVELASVAGDGASFTAEIRRAGALPISQLLRNLRDLQRFCGRSPLLISDYIGPSLRERLADEGISYADATGWVRIVSDSPLILLTGRGAPRAPGAARSSAVVRMNGLAASRIIRALTAVELPMGVRDLADAAGASPGSVSKLLTTLGTEGIVDRDSDGKVLKVRRRSLIERWIRDYSFTKTNKSVLYCIAPRGIHRALDRLEALGTRVVLTGSAAARRMLPSDTISVVPLRLLSLYSVNPVKLAEALGMIDSDPVGANVVLAVPQDMRILEGSKEWPALASPALVLADLLTLPNRSDAEAEQLLGWLERRDPAWRH